MARVIDAKSGEGIPFAYVIAPGVVRDTDESGNWINVFPPTLTIRVHQIGYKDWSGPAANANLLALQPAVVDLPQYTARPNIPWWVVALLAAYLVTRDK